MKPETGTGGFDPNAMTTGDPTAMLQMMGPYVAAFAIVGLLIFAFSIFIQWKIFSKAGYPGALALLNLLLIIPLINIIGCLVVFGLWVWFAFADWPARKGAVANAGPVKS